MNINDKLVVVKKYLKKKKEVNVVELIILKYNDKNYYISLIYNKKLEMYKVLYIPLDLMDNKRVEDFCCYQFIDINTANYIMKTIESDKKKYLKDEVRDMRNTNIDSYSITINTNVNGEEFCFLTTQYLPKEWLFMYDVIVTLFEHCPNIISELCNDILAVLNNNKERIDFKSSFKFDLFNGDIDELFEEKFIMPIPDKNVIFLEYVNGLYYAIVNSHLVIVDYNNSRNILNVYCNCSRAIPGGHAYSAMKAIAKKYERKFYKLVVAEDKSYFKDYTGKFKYYLCYGINNDGFKVIEHNKEVVLPYTMLLDGLIKIGEDNNGELEEILREKLDEIYEKKEFNKMMKNIRGQLPNIK